ncbi:MAG: phosphoribosylformylglycinamidine synthase subunit PurL [Firmicutes bacterium]|nr:phosphoribosylformylglycinamidine synthase subunit PurL [Bacillota bacterium]
MLDTEIKITADVAAQHGLSAEEFARIRQILGRDPNLTELGLFSVMWSEHCSYKSSKIHLRRLPTRGPHVLQGPGENAGVVDIGDGLAAVFKIESHNHPSFVEPFQGAATGVGGILRDIFTMGARPIAVLDSLRFGPLRAVGGGRPSPASNPQRDTSPDELARNRHILEGVVSGIAFYGNCFGVPTVGGEVQFELCYSTNPLVNVLALGIARHDELFFARARGAGNPVIYVGAKTGRDGIHGASLLASAEFSEESQAKRPNVQVGDPFLEKLLLEACLEAMRTGAIVAIQDMGAAGLTCSTCEMASRGGAGIEIELARVPQREAGMTPYEIMLSESQERMLLVAEAGREQQVLDVFAKWGLDAVVIGRVTDDGLLRVLDRGRVVAEVPAKALAEQSPVYDRLRQPPPPRTDESLLTFSTDADTDPARWTEHFCRLLAAPAVASKRWIFEQYDYMVRTNTLVGPGAGDAAVVRIKGTARALALATDGNGRWCWLDPFVGAQHAVAEAARNVACTGARPIAATNCLNFGNPEKPEIMWQFARAVEGIAVACEALGVPITGGNVSFYNETLGRPIYPTPILGVLGLLENAAHALTSGFRQAGDLIVLLDGGSQPPLHTISTEALQREFSSSLYAKTLAGVIAGTPPPVDLAAEKRLIALLVALASEGLLHSAHDLSDGGLAVAVAESCCTCEPPLGAEIQLSGPRSLPLEFALFNERGARAVVSCAEGALARVLALARQYQVTAHELGRTGGPSFRVQWNGTTVLEAPVVSLHELWSTAFERALHTG